MFGMALLERLVAAVERVADRLDAPSSEPSRDATLEDLLKEFVALMENPQSTNEDWASLLEDVKQALGIETSA